MPSRPTFWPVEQSLTILQGSPTCIAGICEIFDGLQNDLVGDSPQQSEALAIDCLACVTDVFNEVYIEMFGSILGDTTVFESAKKKQVNIKK